MKIIAISALLTGASAAFSHESHGLQGSHWHATDVWGFVALGVAFAVAVWWSRGGK
jgi:hypothetical protein